MNEITLRNGALTVHVAINRGAEITHLLTPAGDNMLFRGEWRSPVPADLSQSYGNGAHDWLSSYRGGWQELFPNAGAACTVMDVPLPFHGEVSQARWRANWQVPERDIVLTCAARLPIVIERRMHLHEKRPVLFIEETIHNESALTVPYIWGHHPAFGPQLAAPDARIDLPGGRVRADRGFDGEFVDLMPDSEHRWGAVVDRSGQPVDLSIIPSAPCRRLCYIDELEAGWYALRNPANGLGAGMAWSLADFPQLWLWQEIGGTAFPWYGRAAITALEPASQSPSHGLAAAIAEGTARYLPPHGTASTRLTFTLFAATGRPVTHIDASGLVMN